VQYTNHINNLGTKKAPYKNSKKIPENRCAPLQKDAVARTSFSLPPQYKRKPKTKQSNNTTYLAQTLAHRNITLSSGSILDKICQLEDQSATLE